MTGVPKDYELAVVRRKRLSMNIEDRVRELEKVVAAYNSLMEIHGNTEQLIVQRLLAAEQRILILEHENKQLKSELIQFSQLN